MKKINQLILNKLLVLFFFFLFVFSFSQQKKINYIIIKDSNEQPLKKDTIVYYFSINKAKHIFIKKTKLYQFTFSNDSTEVNGYLNIKKDKIIFSENKKTIKSIEFFKNLNQCNIQYFGKFGDDICLIFKGEGKFEVIQKGLIPSHKLYVSKIYWKMGHEYPDKIYFKEKGSSKEFIALAEPN
ncbi:hypothetical protein [Chryseobacterium jejuense]|uniref:Uncharacterized protein n=1 Tax=Chryseobacterium jejuense TaxID=445960 RepID=A0A2X2VQ70_CHRJE|nr:hypothetical protein [Chryseobacterium jejuense]SDI80831.1 hypothetical protein SAMN05421542_1870 [Chryseobacterium jejuense]SQB27771.1 Uncharacterised protein [Chryseobacterium jejuense]